MLSISPTTLKEYLLCPRSFQYKRIYNLALIPSKFFRFQKKFQERINSFTSNFLSIINSNYSNLTQELSENEIHYLFTSRFYSHLDFYFNQKEIIFKKLDESIFTFLIWLIHFFWNYQQNHNSENARIIPIMIDEPIKSSETRLYGRPSAVFITPDKFTLILTQSYYPKFPHLKEFDHIQAAIYAKILNSLGYKTKYFLSINYYDLTINHFKITSDIFKKLFYFLERFRTSIDEKEFNPPNSPPCNYCEFKLLCQNW